MIDTMRKYLVTIVFKPEAKPAEVLAELTTALGETGKLEGQEELPLKKLAYEIAGTQEATVHQFRLSGSTEIAQTVTDTLRINDQVARFLIKSVDEPKPEVKEAK